MIVVDTSVWIDFLNGRNASHVRELRAVLGTDEVIVGDLMPCEVLQGLDSEAVSPTSRDTPPAASQSCPWRVMQLPSWPPKIFVLYADAA